jgi:hypothetical protein
LKLNFKVINVHKMKSKVNRQTVSYGRESPWNSEVRLAVLARASRSLSC